MIEGGRKSGGQRLAGALLAGPRALRADLWTAAADPLPRMGGPRWRARLPHVLIVVFAVLMDWLPGSYPDQTLSLLAMIQSVALIVAMFRPVPAWWASTIVMVVGAQAAKSPASGVPFAWFAPGLQPRADAPFPWPTSGIPPQAGVAFPWTTSGIALQAGVLLLLALRGRPRVAVETLVITVLAGLYCVTFISEGATAGYDIVTASVLVTATVIGTTLRGRRVARTQLVAQEEITAEERARRTLLEERNRIARELHDVVAHHMSVISIQAQVAPHLVENPSDELKENLAGIRGNAVEALTELRRVLGVLRSEDTLPESARHTPQPTLDRLDELVGNVRGAGLSVTTRITGEPRPLPPGVELSAFRIVQEALSNAMRHAPGSAVRVEIGHHPSGVTVRVTNTAPDRTAPPSRGAGHGLLGMRERTAMLGGELATGATPDGGYEVTAILPSRPPATPADPVEDIQ